MTKRPANDRTHLAEDAADFAKEELLGARQWRRSKIGYLTGASTFTDAGRAIADTGSQAKGRIERLFAYAFRRDYGGIGISTEDVTDSRERFVAAMAANGKTIQEIDHSVGVTYKQFWFYAFLMLACAVIGVGSLVFGGYSLTDNPLMNLAFAVIRFCPLLLLAALTLRAGWTNWSFRRRRLDGIQDYLRSGQILPKSAPMRAKSQTPAKRNGTGPTRGTPKASVALLLLAGLLGYAGMIALFTLPAFAQSPTGNPVNDVFGSPPQSDLFMQLLSYVMPGVGPIPENSTTGSAGPYVPIKAGLALFSGTLLFIGMAMAGWHILTGLVASAKEGQALGRNYHEVWAPARVVIGFGMLTPMIGGLCGAQIIVLYLVAWGGNLANIVWKPYVTAVAFVGTSEGSTALATAAATANNGPLGNSTTQQLFEKYLCYYTIKNMSQRGGMQADQLKYLIPNSPPMSFSQTGGNAVSSFFGGARYEMLNFGTACGQISLQVEKTPSQSKNATGDAARFGVTSISTDTTFEDQNSAAMMQARKRAIEAMVGPISQLAQQAAQTYQPSQGQSQQYFNIQAGDPEGGARNQQLLQTVKQARDGYVQTIVSAMNEQMNTNGPNSSSAKARIDAMREKVSKDGWAAAGTFYLTVSRIQGNLYSAAFGGINSTPINLESTGGLSQFVLEYLAGTKDRPGAITGFRHWWEANISTINSEDKGATQAGANSVWDMISNISLNVAGFFMHLDVNPLNPMQSMIDYGNFLLTFGVSMYAAMAAVGSLASSLGGGEGGSGAAKLIGMIPGLGKIAAIGIGTVVGAISPLLQFAALGMIAAGAVHAYIIPLVPYILTTFFVMSMLLLVVESLVAAPLWAFFHIRMDGQEFVDQVQRPGYMIAFNLILRPVLMIFGLLLSFLTFGAMAWFVGATFMPAARGLAASTTIGPIGAVILIIMLAYINLQLAIKSFQLVTQIPDRVTRWFGQGGDRLGEEEDTHRHTAFLAGQLSGKLEGMARGGGVLAGARRAGQGRALQDGRGKGGPADTAKAKDSPDTGEAPTNKMG